MAASPDVVSAAIEQLEQGFAAFALGVNSKKPVTERGFKNATTKPDWIETQLAAPSAGNYGITWPPDSPELVLALDLDNGAEGLERPWQDRLLELIRRIGPLPATKSTTTPSGGRHAFYRWPVDVPLPPGDELFGFTVRWPGRGYLVGPGSSIDGVAYLPGPEPAIAELPAAWVDAAIAERPARGRGAPGTITIAGTFELPEVIPSGRRYAAVRDYVASRYNSGLAVDELWELVQGQVAPRFSVPKSEADLRADFERAIAKLPERLGPPRHAPVAAIPVGPLEDAPLTEFESQPIAWVWPAWLPRGVVTLMDGNPGVSKSTLVADLVARITTGREWPDGTPADGPQRAMWITTEDDPGRVLRPRIEAADGDASLVRFVKSEVVFPSGAGAFLELVVQRASEPDGLAVVILDPLFSHIEASVRTIADAEMRKGVMNPLAEAAEAAAVAILVVRHFSKDVTASAINRGAGSLGGIVGSARALWSVTTDPEDETGETKVVGVAKLNYARPPAALLYRVVDRLPPGWIVGSVSGIEWLGPAPVSIGTMLTEPPVVHDAVEVLEEILREGPVLASAAQAQMKARGFGRDATRGARARLHVDVRKRAWRGPWEWALPQEVEESAQESADSSDPLLGTDGEEAEVAAPDSSVEEAPDGASDAPKKRKERHPILRVVASRTRGRARGAAPPSDSSDSWEGSTLAQESGPAQEVEEAGASRATRARAVKGRWVAQCRDYAAHRDHHRRTDAGWICDVCNPEGVPA